MPTHMRSSTRTYTMRAGAFASPNQSPRTVVSQKYIKLLWLFGSPHVTVLSSHFKTPPQSEKTKKRTQLLPSRWRGASAVLQTDVGLSETPASQARYKGRASPHCPVPPIRGLFHRLFFYRFLPIFRTFLGDFSHQKLPLTRL